MPIIQSDIQLRHSGGSGNSTPAASLGGAKSNTAVTDATLQNLFANGAAPETEAGSVRYRCVYIHNNHGTLTLQNGEVYLDANTPSADTAVAIGVGSSAVNGTEQTIADQDTAPADITFSAADGEGNALAIGNIPAGQHRAVWVRRTIDADAAALDLDNVELVARGETAE